MTNPLRTWPIITVIAYNVLKRVKILLPQNRANLYSLSLQRYEVGAFFEGLKPDADSTYFQKKNTFNNVEMIPKIRFLPLQCLKHRI